MEELWVLSVADEEHVLHELIQSFSQKNVLLRCLLLEYSLNLTLRIIFRLKLVEVVTVSFEVSIDNLFS